MTASQTPFARVQSDFTSKSDLVSKIKDLGGDLWIDRLAKGGSLGDVSNAKLLRLHTIITEAKSRFASRDALIDALLAAEGRGKDADYKTRFASWPLPRLLDGLKSAETRAKRAAAAKAKTAKKAEPAKKAEAKSAAAPVKKGAAKGATPSKAPAAKKAATASAKKTTAKK